MQAEEEGRIVASLVYTGEVYNFMELRDELKRLGSDTELVLSLNVWLRLVAHWVQDGSRSASLPVPAYTMTTCIVPAHRPAKMLLAAERRNRNAR
jgi:hypothetical protein